MKIIIDRESWLEATNIIDGVYNPVNCFLSESDYISVVKNMHLLDGQLWPIPISLEVSKNEFELINTNNTYEICIDEIDNAVGEIIVSDKFIVNYDVDIQSVYGTSSKDHPGVIKEISRSPYRLGCQVKLTRKHPAIIKDHYYTPLEVKKIIQERNWKTITGFQTRNPPHRAHEYLQRICMNVTEGLFIQPLIGWKKSGDFTPEAVISGYESLIENYYPRSKVLLGTLQIPMRYAGPREAVLHSLIRKNYGCTHFIVGRDHAGVGGFYGKYEAQDLCLSLSDLGINIFTLAGPFYCKKCGHISTERVCSHHDNEILEISGTDIRKRLIEQSYPPSEFMRREVADKLIELSKRDQLFV